MTSAPPRVVLLGASNLVREPWLAVDTARRVVGSAALEVLGAYGHGRSYGMRSRFAGRSVPGIIESGLWRRLDELPAAPTYALLTDVGNDIFYGAEPATIAGWVGECLQRLSGHGARSVLTGLPVFNLDRFSDVEIRLARQLFFPLCRVSVADIRSRVPELERRLRELPERHGAAWVEPEAGWYGIDPIHWRRRRVPEAMARILGAWTGAEPGERARSSLRSWFRLRRMLPESWRWLGVELGRAQPVGVLPGPVSVALF